MANFADGAGIAIPVSYGMRPAAAPVEGNRSGRPEWEADNIKIPIKQNFGSQP